ncbi:hypothetical protein ACWD7Y_17145 [Streptomyces drozdowiczii]
MTFENWLQWFGRYDMIKEIPARGRLGFVMKRSALVVAMLLLGTAACDAASDDGRNTNSTPSAKAKTPVSADEARRVLKDLDAKDDSDSRSPAYWRKIHEGPWLDRTLAMIDNIKKRGKDDPGQDPTNRPTIDPAVHAWVAQPDGHSGDWILGARQIVSRTVGGESEKNEASMRWSLYHRGSEGDPWRIAFTADAPAKTDLPQVAANKSRAAGTVKPDAAGLATQPGKACGEFFDHVAYKDTRGNHLKWSSQIDKYRATGKDTKSLRKQLGNAESVDIRSEGQRKPVGPAWRTKDGGALVACVSVSTVVTDMGAGRWLTLRSSGWDGTTGIRWNKFTQQMMRMTVLKVPVDGTEISIAAQSSWPYKFDGTEYTGD